MRLFINSQSFVVSSTKPPTRSKQSWVGDQLTDYMTSAQVYSRWPCFTLYFTHQIPYSNIMFKNFATIERLFYPTASAFVVSRYQCTASQVPPSLRPYYARPPTSSKVSVPFHKLFLVHWQTDKRQTTDKFPTSSTDNGTCDFDTWFLHGVEIYL